MQETWLYGRTSWWSGNNPNSGRDNYEVPSIIERLVKAERDVAKNIVSLLSLKVL